MKRLLVLVVVLVMTGIMAFSASAMTPVGEVPVPRAAATIDGRISEGEYDNAAMVKLDANNLKASIVDTVPDNFSVTVYFAWSDDYLYVAYDVIDPTKCYFTEYQFNGGDSIQLLLDVGKVLYGRENILDMSAPTLNGARRGTLMSSAPQLKTDGSEGVALYCHLCVAAESVITDPVNFPFASSINDNGWQFEEAIPWTLLVQDMKDKTGEDIAMPSEGTVVTASMIYNDYNAERVLCGFYGSMADESGFDWTPEQHGIELKLVNSLSAEDDESSSTDTSDVTNDEENGSADTSDGMLYPVVLFMAISSVVVAVSARKKGSGVV